MGNKSHMVDAILKYWQLFLVVVTIVGGAISGYIWLDDQFDGIDTRLQQLDNQFASVDQIANLARSEELHEGFDQIDSSLERVRCELDALINAGDLLSAAEAVDSKLHVLELEKQEVLGRDPFTIQDQDDLDQIRQNYNMLKERQNKYIFDAQKYRRIIETRQCE